MKMFREWTGITIAALTVIAFLLVGFAQMTAMVIWGIEVKAPDAWFSGLLSLSSAALGFLIGKNVDSASTSPYIPPPVASDDNCPHCGMPIHEPSTIPPG